MRPNRYPCQRRIDAPCTSPNKSLTIRPVTPSPMVSLSQVCYCHKSSSCGRRYIEVSSRNSTRTCSACGQLSGPSGLASLSVRQWACDCGVTHDRDINAAVNVLIAARGMRVERVGDDSSGIAIDATRRSSTAREGLTAVNRDIQATRRSSKGREMIVAETPAQEIR